MIDAERWNGWGWECGEEWPWGQCPLCGRMYDGSVVGTHHGVCVDCGRDYDRQLEQQMADDYYRHMTAIAYADAGTEAT